MGGREELTEVEDRHVTRPLHVGHLGTGVADTTFDCFTHLFIEWGGVRLFRGSASVGVGLLGDFELTVFVRHRLGYHDRVRLRDVRGL